MFKQRKKEFISRFGHKLLSSSKSFAYASKQYSARHINNVSL